MTLPAPNSSTSINLGLSGPFFRLFLVLFICQIALSVPAQNVVSVHAQLGFWSPILNNDALAYADFSNWATGTQGLGALVNLHPERRFSFAPSLELARFRYRYQASAPGWYETVDVQYLVVGLSPGMRVRMSNAFSVRAGWTVNCAALGKGSLSLTAGGTTTDYGNGLGTQVNRFNNGPDLDLSWRVVFKRGGALLLGPHGYVSLNRLVHPNSGLKVEPGLWQLVFRLGWEFSEMPGKGKE